MATIADKASSDAPKPDLPDGARGVRGEYTRTVLIDPDEVHPCRYVHEARQQISAEDDTRKTYPSPKSVTDTRQKDGSRWIAVTFKVWHP